METPELKPCPFCGSDNLVAENVGKSPLFVKCLNCECFGPDRQKKGLSAVELWNARAEVKAEKGATDGKA